MNKTVVEPEKRVPIAYDVDVAVAGAGVSGVFAAIAAARSGAETVLIDRFGYVGGNIGPGMIVNGHMASGSPHPDAGFMVGIHKGFAGIADEFIKRHASLGGGGVIPFSRSHYPRDASTASYTALKMLRESGVELLLSCYAADPVMDGDRVCGVFFEGKSGRQAVRAKVVVDATGDADVARRAGAAVLHPKQEYAEVDGHSPTGMGMAFVVGRVDWEAYARGMRDMTPDDEDRAWARETFGEKRAGRFGSLLKAFRRAWDKGEFPDATVEGLGEARVGISSVAKIETCYEEGLAWGDLEHARTEAMDTGDTRQMSLLEARSREIIFERVRFYTQYVPGFEKAYLLCVAPFLGARGGPCIEGDYTLTMDDCRAGRQFEDVVYLFGEFRAIRYTSDQGQCKWVEVPYRVMVPKAIDGLLAVGRCASGRPDTLLRNRMAVKHMGEAGGIAAALAAQADIPPRHVDVKELQRRLLSSGFYLGDAARLKQLEILT